MQTVRLSLSLAALLGSALASPAADGGYREFKSWQVSCSQTLSCNMRQFVSGGEIGQVELRRAGGPEAAVIVSLSPNSSAIGEATGALSASLSIDEGEAMTIPASAIEASADGWSIRLTGDFIGNGFIAALEDGSALQVLISRGAVSIEADFSLAGAAASLLFMDEYQKRIGHQDALSAKGDKAPNPALPIADISRFADFPEALQARFAEGGECADTAEGMLDGNALAHKLSDDQTVYVTPCGAGGAYNMPYAVFLDSFGSVSMLAFPTMVENAPSATSHAFNLGYGYETKSLSAFFKGRGVGDCGTASEWKLAERFTGPQLVLVEEAFRDCPAEFDESDAADPANWPKTWPRP